MPIDSSRVDYSTVVNSLIKKRNEIQMQLNKIKVKELVIKQSEQPITTKNDIWKLYCEGKINSLKYDKYSRKFVEINKSREEKKKRYLNTIMYINSLIADIESEKKRMA